MMATPTPIEIAERQFAAALLETERIRSAHGTLVATSAVEREAVVRQAMELVKNASNLCGRYECRRVPNDTGFCVTHAPKQVAS